MAAATDAFSLASVSARATPRAVRTDASSVIILPKAQVLSSNSFSAAEDLGQGGRREGGGGGSNSEQQMPFSPPPTTTSTTTARGEISAQPTEGKFEVRNGLVVDLVPATIRELELQLVSRRQEQGAAGNQSNELKETAATARLIRGDSQAKRPNNDGTKRAFGHTERLRTVTWPSLRYKEWMDASFLSFHRLSSDYRVTSVESEAHRFLSEQRHNLTSSATGNKERPKVKASSSNNEDEFVVGAPEKWRVSSSHVVRKARSHQVNEAMANEGNDELVKTIELPRLPSRLGRNSLQCFLDNSDGKRSNLHIRTQQSLKSNRGRGQQQHQGTKKRTLPLPQGSLTSPAPAAAAPSTMADAVLLPAQRARESVLRLQGCVRNPGTNTSIIKGHQQQQQQRGEHGVNVDATRGLKAVVETNLSLSATHVGASSSTKRSPKGGTKKQKQLSFKIPADLDPLQQQHRQPVPRPHAAHRGKVAVRSVSWGMETDVSVLPTTLQLKLEDAYCITKCTF